MTPDAASRIYRHLDSIVEACRAMAQLAPQSRDHKRLRLREIEQLTTEALDAIAREHPRATDGPPPCCSFCGKTQPEVAKLIAGPSAYICDECIALSSVIVAKEKSSNGAKSAAQGPAMEPSDYEPTEKAASYRRSVRRPKGKE